MLQQILEFSICSEIFVTQPPLTRTHGQKQIEFIESVRKREGYIYGYTTSGRGFFSCIFILILEHDNVKKIYLSTNHLSR